MSRVAGLSAIAILAFNLIIMSFLIKIQCRLFFSSGHATLRKYPFYKTDLKPFILLVKPTMKTTSAFARLTKTINQQQPINLAA